MNATDKRRYDMLTRVQKFGLDHGQRFPTTCTAPGAFAEVDAELQRLVALDVAERDASEGARAARRDAARAVFENTLTRAGATARVLGQTIPHLEARIRLPLPKDDLQLLTLARQFAKAVAGHGPHFEAHGIPLTELETGITTFDAAVKYRGNSRDDRLQARAEIEESFTRAMQAVHTIDVTVANYLGDDTVAVKRWKQSRRIKPPRRSAVVTDPLQPATPDVPAAAASIESPAAPALVGRDPQLVPRSLGEGGSGPGVSDDAAKAA